MTAMATANGGTRITANEPGRLMEYVPFGQTDKVKLSVKIVQDMLCVKTKAGHACTDTEALKYMMQCQAKRLNPFDGDSFMIGYDTKDGPSFAVVTAHQAFLKRAENHPEYDGMESGVIVADADGNVIDREGDFFFDDDTIIGGWATVHFKNRKYPMKKRLRLKAFHKGTKIWNENPGGMIVKCAEADALRSSFPTLLGGLYSVEEQSPPAITLELPEEGKPTRQRIAGTRKAAVQQEEPAPAPVQSTAPANNTTFADDGSEPAPAAEDAKQVVFNFLDAIAQTTTKAGLTKIGGELKASNLGEEWHKEVMAAWQAKYKALSEAT